MNRNKALCSCIFLSILFGCGPAPAPDTNSDPLAEEIKGSALKPLTQSDKKDLVNYGKAPLAELAPEEKERAINFLAKQLSFDLKKSAKQSCHLGALHEKTKEKCIASRKECLENIKKLDLDTKKEELAKGLQKSPLSAEMTWNILEKMASVYGSDEAIKAQCGDDMKSILKILSSKLESIPKELGLTEAQIQAFSAALAGEDAPQPDGPQENLPPQTLEEIKKKLDKNVSQLVNAIKDQGDAEIKRFKAFSNSEIRKREDFKLFEAQLDQGMAEGVLKITAAEKEQLLDEFINKVKAGL